MAILWAVAGGVAGTLLLLHRALMVAVGVADCTLAPGQTQCLAWGHPFWWVGILVYVLAIVGSIALWRIGNNLRAGLTVTGYPRE